MAIELRVPALGESITQATVGAWLKQVGDRVQRDEPVVEVESEKATMAVPAPADGILRRILKPSGASVAVGELIGELEPGAPQAQAQAQAQAPEVSPLASVQTPAAVARAEVSHPDVEGAILGVTQSVARASPSVRRLLAEQGLDLQAMRGGPVICRAEVARAIAALDREPRPGGAETDRARPEGAEAGERIVPMSPLRKTVARRLVEAQRNAALLTTFNEVDLSRVLALRERHGAAFQEKYGVKLGFMSFFAKATVEALRAWPVVNASVRGDDLVFHDHCDLGVAVGGGKGLVVPVIRAAERLGFAEIEQRIAELAKKARENRIAPGELEGGTFTISNGGVYGSLLSTPILNPPQSGILGLHKMEKRPVVGPGDTVVVRPMMYLALSYDHRVIDGREAVSFLVKIKECVEEPERILLGI